MSKESCEELILTVGGQHDYDLNPGFVDLEPSAVTIAVVLVY